MAYIGASQEQYYAQSDKRFFYGLRRTDNGELFLAKVDQLGQDDVVQINKIGDPTDNYPNFEEGQEFFEGRDYNHNLVYQNLNYEQFKHDDRDIWYYINAEGELCVRVNEDHLVKLIYAMHIPQTKQKSICFSALSSSLF